MTTETWLLALALSLVALEGAPAALNISSTGHDLPGIARATTNTSCKCGKKLTGNRIVGGQETDINEYPWQAALADLSGYLFCGGSLITDRHVITAAHCVIGKTPNELFVLLREHSKQQVSETKVVTKGVSRITRHSKYNDKTQLNDITVLTLDSPVEVSPNLLPVCLPSDPKLTYEGETATATGWGITSAMGSSPDELREVDVPVVSSAVCKKQTNYHPSEIFKRMLCAGAKGIDSCQGDSGGPLVFKNDFGNYDLIGVVSWGVGCGDEGYPGVYTRVNKYLEWIKSKTKDGTYCRSGSTIS